jgi:hypothetical protein
MTYMPGNIVRARNGNGLSEEQLRAAVPAIFAEHKHDSRSDKYTYIPTINVIEGLVQSGYKMVEARQGRSRIAGKQEFTKHMLRFRHSTLDLRVGDTTAEVVMINSHDGTSRYKLMSGLFKLLCLNGLVVPEGPYAEVAVTHHGNIVQKVIEGSAIVLDNAAKVLDKPKQWSQLQLTSPQREAFAEAARVVRFGDKDGRVDSPVTAQQLLTPRRSEDSGNDLWRTFNVVQENAVKGGIFNQQIVDGHLRRSTTREIRGISEDVKLNRALWVLAEKLAEAV